MCLIIVGKHLTCIYLPHWKSWLQLELLTAKKIFLGALCFLVYDQVQGLDTERQRWFFIKDLLEDEQGLSMGGMLALLKYPFYPLFNFDNDMNLILKSPTILTSAQLLVVFTFAYIFWRYFVFAGFWPILEHEMARPTITRWHEEDEGQSPNKGSNAMMIRGPFMHIHPPMKPKRQSPQDKIKILRG